MAPYVFSQGAISAGDYQRSSVIPFVAEISSKEPGKNNNAQYCDKTCIFAMVSTLHLINQLASLTLIGGRDGERIAR